MGSEALAEALCKSPCGCDQLAASERETDPIAAAVIAAESLPNREAWRCPYAGYRLGTSETLPNPCRDALKATERLTGAAGFATCPGYYARLPWVREVTTIYARLKDGIPLSDQVGAPSQQLLSALDCVREGIAARERHEWDAIKKRQARQKPDEQ